MEYFSILGIALLSAAGGALLSGGVLSRKMRKKTDYILDALEDRETNFRFDERKLFFKHYNRTLNRIRVLFEREKAEILEREHYYGQMLECVRTGIVVVDLSAKREGRVIYRNRAALNMLGMSTFSHVRQLRAISETLEAVFERKGERQEERCSFYNERGKITISIVPVETQLQGKPVRIFMFNDVTEDMVKHEEMSWNKLIRVMTHEIMNTITPVASLSKELLKDLQEQEENREELKQGLDTINKSSEGLIKFVENYRRLTRVAVPRKTPVYFRELVAGVQTLVHSQLESASAHLEYVEKSDDILLYADTQQISQLLLNLVKNALQAGATQIRITASIDFAEAVVVQVWNDGRMIDQQNQEEIFVPFYTTKQEGTGIGLSLSRQIMRLHNGTLTLERSDEKGTMFQLIFR